MRKKLGGGVLVCARVCVVWEKLRMHRWRKAAYSSFHEIFWMILFLAIWKWVMEILEGVMKNLEVGKFDGFSIKNLEVVKFHVTSPWACQVGVFLFGLVDELSQWLGSLNYYYLRAYRPLFRWRTRKLQGILHAQLPEVCWWWWDLGRKRSDGCNKCASGKEWSTWRGVVSSLTFLPGVIQAQTKPAFKSRFVFYLGDKVPDAIDPNTADLWATFGVAGQMTGLGKLFFLPVCAGSFTYRVQHHKRHWDLCFVSHFRMTDCVPVLGQLSLLASAIQYWNRSFWLSSDSDLACLCFLDVCLPNGFQCENENCLRIGSTTNQEKKWMRIALVWSEIWATSEKRKEKKHGEANEHPHKNSDSIICFLVSVTPEDCWQRSRFSLSCVIPHRIF